ncbi:hypothetical protein D3C81_1863060 [compost metagenome]
MTLLRFRLEVGHGFALAYQRGPGVLLRDHLSGVPGIPTTDAGVFQNGPKSLMRLYVLPGHCSNNTALDLRRVRLFLPEKRVTANGADFVAQPTPAQ